MKFLLFHICICISILTLLLQSCDSNNIIGTGKPIKMGDKDYIVTETDTTKLKNYVRDISQTAQTESEIARIMVQVDSVKVKEELQDFANADSSITGFTIAFSNCTVQFDGLEAKELSPQNPEENRSVSYIVSKGDLAKMKLKITGLKDASVKERVFTKLKVASGGEEYLLKSLGRKISDWFPLAGVKNIFVAAGDNSFQFNNLNNAKLKEALKKELQAKNKSQSEINNWLVLVKNTNNYTDAPCKLYVSTAQFNVQGKNTAGDNVSKLIQFDIVE